MTIDTEPIQLMQELHVCVRLLGAPAGVTGDAAQPYMNNWSSTDYVQLVAEKVTAFEREHKELSLVLFDQVSVDIWP